MYSRTGGSPLALAATVIVALVLLAAAEDGGEVEGQRADRLADRRREKPAAK